ncbi:hypothetical protein DK419_13470 [Methylobacterium terrae]|uniref:Uncharacterized protein n=1 Tax=Methylobacterium terrae TaxID=2202827 RepID=A0A2U8WPS6_9HYPH|nr:hypothetical protein [Methylobacterium terrae]AWN47202.1 hypothetical protein DK419_13470 [Methylobacterium terrae]
MTEIEIPALTRRAWWPEAYADESMPAGRETPSAWLYQLDDGARRYGERDGQDYPTWPIAEGQTVKFLASDDLGSCLLIVEDDGTTQWEPRPPEGAYLYDRDDREFGGDGPDDFVKNLRDFGILEPGMRMVVRVERLQPDVECRFTTAGGPPRFVALTPLPPIEEATEAPTDPEITAQLGLMME